MEIQHRWPKKHQNADALSKEFYEAREARQEEQYKVRTGILFLSKKQFNELPLLTHVDIHGRTIPEPPKNVVQNLTVSVGPKQQGKGPSGKLVSILVLLIVNKLQIF